MEKLKQYIIDYMIREFDYDESDLNDSMKDLSHVPLLYTTTDDERELNIYADLINNCLDFYIDDVFVGGDAFPDSETFANWFTDEMDFDFLYSCSYDHYTPQN